MTYFWSQSGGRPLSPYAGERVRVRGRAPGGNQQRMARLTAHARRLRHDQTDAERRLWSRLRGRQCGGAKFRRQHPVPPFITDFCCVERRLVVELDGSQHAATPEADLRRTQFLQSEGYKVLRFWDTEVLQQLDAVVDVIQRALQTPSP